MTKEEILAMKAGGELDAHVAAEIMHDCYHQHWKDNEDSIICRKCGESRFYHQQSQNYSTDISAAWQVVEKMRALDTYIEIGNGWQPEQFWWVKLKPEDIYAWSKTLPEVICKAALLAKKEMDNHG